MRLKKVSTILDEYQRDGLADLPAAVGSEGLVHIGGRTYTTVFSCAAPLVTGSGPSAVHFARMP